MRKVGIPWSTSAFRPSLFNPLSFHAMAVQYRICLIVCNSDLKLSFRNKKRVDRKKAKFRSLESSDARIVKKQFDGRNTRSYRKQICSFHCKTILQLVCQVTLCDFKFRYIERRKNEQNTNKVGKLIEKQKAGELMAPTWISANKGVCGQETLIMDDGPTKKQTHLTILA